MKEKNLCSFFKRTVIKSAEIVAKVEANSTCPFISYQPILPKAVLNLRKNND